MSISQLNSEKYKVEYEELEIAKTIERQANAVLNYGSYPNYKRAMMERDCEKAFLSFQHRVMNEHKKSKSAQQLCEEDIIDAMSADKTYLIPAFLNPFALAGLALGAIGIPVPMDDEAARNKCGDDLRDNRLARVDGSTSAAKAYDYHSYGWPTGQGSSSRIVSPEEHQEILKRLENAGLAKVGSPVGVVGFGLDEILVADLKQPPWLIHGLLRKGGACMVYGPSGIGKSWLTYTLALGLAAGRELEIKDDTQKPVLTFGNHNGVKVGIVDGEMIMADFGQRMKDLIDGLNLKPINVASKTIPPIEPEEFYQAAKAQAESPWNTSDEDDLEVALSGIRKLHEEYKQKEVAESFTNSSTAIEFDSKNIGFFTKTKQDPRAKFVSIVDRNDKLNIISWAKKKQLDVIVLDNLSTLSSGMDNENDAVAIEPLNELIVSCKKEGIAVLLVHHTNKNGESYRGSSNISTTLETIIRLADVKGPKEGAKFQVLLEKDRNMGRLGLHKKVMTLKVGRWFIEEDTESALEEIIEALRTLEFISQKEIGDYLNIDQSNVSRALQRAEGQGKLKKDEAKMCFKSARDIREGRDVSMGI